MTDSMIRSWTATTYEAEVLDGDDAYFIQATPSLGGEHVTLRLVTTDGKGNIEVKGSINVPIDTAVTALTAAAELVRRAIEDA